MQKPLKSAPTAASRGLRQPSKTNAAIVAKLPAYAKALADRQRFKNLPFLVAVCVGGDAWNAAKRWKNQPEHAALVLTPEQNPTALSWPVSGCLCVIDWSLPAPETLLIDLVKCLLIAGAESVIVWPTFVDFSMPSVGYDMTKPIGQRWVTLRESVKIYRRPPEVRHAA